MCWRSLDLPSELALVFDFTGSLDCLRSVLAPLVITSVNCISNMAETKDISMHSFLADEPKVEVTPGHEEEKKGNAYDQRDMQRMGKRQESEQDRSVQGRLEALTDRF